MSGSPKKDGLCALRVMSDLRLGGVLPGILLRDGQLEVDGTAFPCCGGRGMRFDVKTNQTRTCEVGLRLKRVRHLAQSGVPLRDLPETFAKSPDFHRGLKRLKEIADGQSQRGLFFSAPMAQEGGALNLKALAMSGAWRLGLDAHVFDAKSKDIWGDLARARSGTSKVVLFAEGFKSLWEASEADLLEAVIGFAYQSKLPLFLSVPINASVSEPVGARRGASYAARIAAIKARDPFSWIGPGAKAKLLAVTDGAPSKAAQRRPKSETRPEVPKLPWDP